MEKLPEKWCVIRNKESYQAVNKWFNEMYKPKKPFSKWRTKDGLIYWHHPKLGSYWVSSFIDDGYTFLSYEDFLRLVVGIEKESYQIY